MKCRVDHIPIDQCKDGFLYIIDARNAHVGIYTNKEKAFTIPRHKFYDWFLFDEYHWDTGAPFGTAHPLKEIGPAPQFKDDVEKLKWLMQKSDDLNAQSIDLLWEKSEDIRNLYKDKDKYLKARSS